MPRPRHPLLRRQAHPMTGAPVVAAAPAVQVGTQGALVVPVIPAAAIAAMTKQQILGATPMQNIVTLGEINDALKIAAVTAAQLADMGFAALANKPICEGLPPEESRRLRNAKLYPAESIGQIRVALAQRFAEPTTAADVPASGAAALSEYLKTCEQHQIVPDVGGAFASAFAAGFNLASSQAAQREATAAIKTLQNLGYTYHDAELWKPPIGKVPDFDLVDSLRNRISELEASQAAPAAVAVPDDRAAFERELIDNHHYVPSDFSFKDGFYGGDDDYIQFGWDVWQARAALDATPAAAPVDKSPELQGSVVDKTVNLQDAAAAPVVPHEPDRIARNLMQFVGLDKDTARKCQEVVRCALLATATGLPAQAVEQSPVLYVSKEQLDSHTDHADSEAGRYLPCRITPAGKFITPLFAVPHSQEFQQRVQPWMMACFGPEISADSRERNHRFLEEALELVQCLGCTASEAHQLVDYVYGRPWGESAQEAGGVMVTLAALCLANGLDMHACGETELARIWTKVEAIRAKQAAKPKHSPLPMHVPEVQAEAEDAESDYQRGYRHGYNRRNAEVQGALL